jgi:tRNA U34 5-methylaminomethyl-2-thiouridine-forming methyltransferase MnmC
MERIPIITKDGSHTISIPGQRLTYHSHHGAIAESMHVYIQTGLRSLENTPGKTVSIFEMGFGTGLNALLTYKEALEQEINIQYTAIELHPLDPSLALSLNYPAQIDAALQPVFEKLHHCSWETDVAIAPNFTLRKVEDSIFDFSTDKKYDLVYYDAFAPSAQPELWRVDAFQKITALMHPDATLVTYCSKSIVRHAMKAAGLTVKKVPGPYGKREIVRAELHATPLSNSSHHPSHPST